jgi:hypothetical protein
MREYCTDVCKDEIAKAIADPQNDTLLYAYPTEPQVSMKIWEAVQRMPQVQLEWVLLRKGTANVLEVYNENFNAVVNHFYKLHPNASLSVPMATLLREHAAIEPTRKLKKSALLEVIMPTTKFIERVERLYPGDADDHMEREEHDKMRAYIAETFEIYQDVCLDGTRTVALEEWLSLSESCVLLTALEHKWSKEVRYKCVCERFFREAVCEHVVLFSMFICPAEVVPPDETDIRVVNRRKSKKRGRSGIDDLDDTEEKREKPKKDKKP